ncbi:unnamed protein product [Didymodactylos carnosus]|uniref:Coiled-coil domain-containing protein 93 n=1 Tax=Didymodactylos carnosus TaxID=1234261 RepID=A0A8S2ECJ3_9BILA|nr:unnamed protein product [Didymodactylos carnosus]CAF3982871.1 unnamed protein product [Didymodactylos carnosus]
MMEQKIQEASVKQKLATRDQEGKLIKFEVRDDPEQKNKCDETMELLLAAGYFRVRIKGLSEFDKIVGGLAWCIQACNFAVDIDVLYQENSILRQKIALTERIVLVLSQMKCPFNIEPHQIQGLDFIHIYPIVQWLVKRVFDRRAEVGDFTRAYALNQYEKQFLDKNNIVQVNEKKPLTENVEMIRMRYRPKRRYRYLETKKKKYTRDERKRRVHSTLLEFGQMHQLLLSDNSTSSSTTNENQQNDTKSTVDAMMKNMAGEKTKITTQKVNTLVSKEQNNLIRLLEEYEEKEAALLQEAATSETGQQQLLIRTLTNQLNKQKEKINNSKTQLNEAQEKKQLTFDEAKEALIKQQREQIESEIEQLEKDAQNIDPESLKRVQILMGEYESLKKQETEKKNKYKAEKVQLEQEISKLEARLKSDMNDDPENERMKQIDEQFQQINDRLQKQRLLLVH